MKIAKLKQKFYLGCAMRGRNPEHPTDRTPGINLVQRIEINWSLICNCITTVSKDTLVLEIIDE